MNITKLKVISASLIIGIIIIFSISYFTLPILNISTTPTGSNIYINGQFSSKSPYSLRLKKDIYQIKITNEDYIDYAETIDLNSNYNLNIVLKPKENVGSKNTQMPHSLTLSTSAIQGNYLLSIDRNTSNLIKVDDEGTTIIHSEPVNTFDHVNQIVALNEKNKLNSIIFINLETKVKKRIFPSETIIMSALSMSPTSNDVFVLGNINTINRTSGLFKVKSDGSETTKISDTNATSIKALNDQYIVEFAYADQNNTSIVSLIDTFSKKVIFSKTGNSFLVSPDNTVLAVFSSEKITLFSYLTRSLVEHKLNNSVVTAWLDSKTILLLANGRSGTEFSLLNTETNIETEYKKVTNLNGVYVKTINGITKSNIYLTSVDGILYSIPRPVIEASH